MADKKELFGTGYGRIDNVEQEESSMTWTLDNWLYTTFNTFRSRWTPSGVVKETSGSTMGSEWGLTQDDDGKQWYLEGSNGIPTYWQFPIVYGNVNIPDGLDPDVRVPWGAPVKVADMQGGMGIVRMPDGSSNQTTAGAGGVTHSRRPFAEGPIRQVLLTVSRSRAWSGACPPRTRKD